MLPLLVSAWLAASPSGPVVLDPLTQLSIETRGPGGTVCVLSPRELHDNADCGGLGLPQDKEPAPKGNVRIQMVGFLRLSETRLPMTLLGVEQRPPSAFTLSVFIESMLKSAQRDKGPFVHLVKENGDEFRVRTVNGVPIARWRFSADLPKEHPRYAEAAAIYYLVPSRDRVDVFSFQLAPGQLDQASEATDRLIATVRVPLTIEPKSFATGPTLRSFFLYSGIGVAVLLIAALVIVLLARRGSKRNVPANAAPPR